MDKENVLKMLKERLDAAKKEIPRLEDAISLIEELNIEPAKVDDDHKEVFTVEGVEYRDYTIPQKIHYALSLLGSGFAKEVGEKLYDVDPAFGLERALERSTYHLSSLYNAGEIGAEKIGNKNRYFMLNKKSTQ